VTQTATKQQPELTPQQVQGDVFSEEILGTDLQHTVFARLNSLWKQRRAIQRATLAGLLAGTLLAFSLPRRYEATTQLMPPDNQSTSGLAMLAALSSKSGGGLGAFAGDLLGLKSSGALFVGILRSQTVEDRLVERFQLKRVYSVKLEEDAREKLAENTGLSEDRKSGIIAISVTDRDPNRAAAIAQAYVDELNHLVVELSTSSAHRERVFLEERLAGVKRDLDDASLKFSQFASKNTAIDIKEQGRAMVDAAAKLQGELIAAESESKGLEQIYTANNVRVRAVQARISELRRQLEKLGAAGTATEVNQTGDSTHPLYPSIRELPILGVTYGDLYRRTRIQEAVYEALTQQYELAKVQEAKETPSVRVLDAARVPERKSFPPRLLITSLVSFLFLGAAIFCVLVRMRWDETDTKDPGKLFVQEMFQTMNGHMPWATPNGSRLQAMTHRVWVRLARGEDSEKS
jgi:uncharacterized protein involved in exopolysaccharide biosynthesis